MHRHLPPQTPSVSHGDGPETEMDARTFARHWQELLILSRHDPQWIPDVDRNTDYDENRIAYRKAEVGRSSY